MGCWEFILQSTDSSVNTMYSAKCKSYSFCCSPLVIFLCYVCFVWLTVTHWNQLRVELYRSCLFEPFTSLHSHIVRRRNWSLVVINASFLQLQNVAYAKDSLWCPECFSVTSVAGKWHWNFAPPLKWGVFCLPRTCSEETSYCSNFFFSSTKKPNLKYWTASDDCNMARNLVISGRIITVTEIVVQVVI